MTDTAILGRRQVIGVFAAGGNTIVAGRTVVHDIGVIKHPGGKAADTMACPAILAGRDVRR